MQKVFSIALFFCPELAGDGKGDGTPGKSRGQYMQAAKKGGGDIISGFQTKRTGGKASPFSALSRQLPAARCTPFMKIERYQRKPLQPLSKTDSHPIVVTTNNVACYLLQAQTTVLSRKNDIHNTCATICRKARRFHIETGNTHIPQGTGAGLRRPIDGTDYL